MSHFKSKLMVTMFFFNYVLSLKERAITEGKSFTKVISAIPFQSKNFQIKFVPNKYGNFPKCTFK